ncbi:polysaccharide deacetylase [Colletotrichum graminicola M1.001]|uniref:Polysaccharide deacetylase n=1 Tax=Colletotrichum graminicola (strain M1.001 / M2 / FGSC 10212) TaxID=645133 RepID=E3QDG8_COLGM|nr:polysaccharide deacetylase [Colletotrichum graminicola M1.001]EFQ28940.1 polysaccharide deacetylase [Colletotrichum graminicola M1.001]
MIARVHSLFLLVAVVASGELAAAIPLESSSAFATRDMDRPRFGNVPYGVDITRCTVNGKVALTFDDGPGEYTEKVLDTLEKNGNIKATFFLVGTNGQNGINNPAYTPLLKRMLGAGHQLGSHSWSHKDFNTITHDQQVEELVKNEEVFAKTLGIVPTYFRPPYTHCDDKCISTLNDLSYHVADYNLDTKDWVDDGVNSKQTYSSAINSANPSSSSFIALAHDIHKFTVDGFVQYMIDVAKEKGFEFSTVGECLGDPVSNWYRDPKSGEPSDDKEEPKATMISKSVTPTTSSVSEETKETKETKTTSSTTESETAKASMTVKTGTDEPESKTDGPTSTGAIPPAATRTVDDGVNIGIPVTPAGTTAALRPTSTNTVVEVNAAGRAVLSAGGALAGALAWAMMI